MAHRRIAFVSWSKAGLCAGPPSRIWRMQQPGRRRITSRLPEWLWNSNPRGFGQAADLRMIPVKQQPNAWELQAEENYARRAPALLSFETLAGSGLPDNLARLDQLDIATDQTAHRQRNVATEIERIQRSRPGDFAAHATVLCLRVTTAPNGQVETAARDGLGSWLGLRQGDGQPTFPYARVHVIKVDRALQFRAGLSRILLRAESEPALWGRPPANAHEPIEHFSSGRELLKGLYFIDPYLSPLLAGNAPYVWSFTAPRAGAIVLFDLGTFARGTRGEPAEALQMFGPQGTTQFLARPTVRPSDLEAAARWWVQHLNGFLGLISDPVPFARADGITYSPQGHMQTLLSVEHLFRHVQSMLTQVRDKHARRLALFGFLDTYEGLMGRDVVASCTLSVAEKSLAKLEAALDPAVACVLLPPAKRAVEALRAVQAGFSLGTDVAAQRVRLPAAQGHEDLPLEKAAASYLYVLRNATHGYGGKNDASRRRNDALLASHSGDLPDDLPMLAYLYALTLVLDPSGLYLRLAHHSFP